MALFPCPHCNKTVDNSDPFTLYPDSIPTHALCAFTNILDHIRALEHLFEGIQNEHQ